MLSPRAGGGEKAISSPRCLSHPSCAAPRHSNSCLPDKRREAGRQKTHRRVPHPFECGARLDSALAFRRPTAVSDKAFDLAGLGLSQRFLESPDANGRTLSGTSAASTSQSGTRRTG